ncbi:MAG: Hpt domain-containing protein [Pseudobdellovibrionaceae bacterium]|nr:Hpt domain-containing protein [Bdellovibrionales bacterium]USN47587.1 MAG: Hpt domain-containing protein [Pseudobdellovibrionaceae bacterium]
MAESSPIDEGLLDYLFRDQLAGDLGTLTHLIDIFFDHTPARIQAMGEALSRGDLNTLERMAHDVKSNAGTLGAKSLQDHARDIEKHAQAHAASAILATLLSNLQACYDSTAAALTEKLRKYEEAV